MGRLMRNVIILHAPEDAALAADFVRGHSEIWVASAVSEASAAGAFGPRFRLVAIWSAAAASGGLAPIFTAMFKDRETPSILLKADGAPIPSDLAQAAAMIGRADRTGLSTALADQPLASSKPPPRFRPFGIDAAARAIAAAILSVGFGALLANATAVDRPDALSADFGLAPIERRLEAPVEAVEPVAADVAVAARAQAMLERAESVARSPAAAARARTVDLFHASPD